MKTVAIEKMKGIIIIIIMFYPMLFC
jgi:hypothetical protein